MKERISSIDIVRGVVMVIMALDHSRDFMHYPGNPPLDLQSTSVILFFTRWITHFCAPAFIFLSGISVFLAGQKRTRKDLRVFLLRRGLWLIASDILLISLIFSFDLSYHTLILEVLWAAGFGMILLSVLLYAPIQITSAIAVILFFGHDLLNYLELPQAGLTGALSKLLLSGRGVFIPLGGGRAIAVLYTALPWAGVLLMGYIFGILYANGYDAKKRKWILRSAGILGILLFIILRLVNHYGDPATWSPQRNGIFTMLSFLNTTKQSPSLLFLLMTLSPILILLSFTEGAVSRAGRFFATYGKVPYLYFIVHFMLLRLINVLLAVFMHIPFVSDGSPIVWQFKDFGTPLWNVYLIWISVVLILYYPCAWYGRYKQRHQHWWLSYL